MSKYTKDQLVEITTEYLEGEVFSVVKVVAKDIQGDIYEIERNGNSVYRYEREIKAYEPVRVERKTLDKEEYKLDPEGNWCVIVHDFTASKLSFNVLIGALKVGALAPLTDNLGAIE